MKKITINIVFFVGGIVLLDIAQMFAYGLIKENWSTWNLAGAIIVFVLSILAIVMLASFGINGLSHFGRGESKRAKFYLDKGDLVMVHGQWIKNDELHHYGISVIICRYPFNVNRPRLLHFKVDEFPDFQDMRNGWKYIWDGKKLVSATE